MSEASAGTAVLAEDAERELGEGASAGANRRRERGRVVVFGGFAVAERQADALNTACLADAERRDGAVAVGADLGRRG